MLKFEPCIWSTNLLDKLELQNAEASRVSYPTRVDITLVKKAIYYCKKYHADQKRDSGEPYYSHPITVANMVTQYVFNTNVVVAALLHDIIEDTEVTAPDIKSWFGGRVAEMVEGLTRNKKEKKFKVRCSFAIPTLLIFQLSPTLPANLFKYTNLLYIYFFKTQNKQKLNPNCFSKLNRISLSLIK